MRLDQVDLNLFIVLDAVYREASVTRTAQVLNITQPAVSNALARLRRIFDDPLFVRTPEGMKPTPLTESVIVDVKKALTLLGSSVTHSARFDAAQSEKIFRVAMSNLTEALFLPRLYTAIAQIAPGVSMEVFYPGREQAAESLKSGTLDLLLDAPLIKPAGLEQHHLCQLPFVLAMRKGHPLSDGHIDLQTYLNADHIHVSSRRTGSGQVDMALRAIGRQRRIKVRVQDYQIAVELTRTSDLLWGVPEEFAKLSALSTAPLPFSIEPMRFSLYWSKSADTDPANQWIRTQIISVCAN